MTASSMKWLVVGFLTEDLAPRIACIHERRTENDSLYLSQFRVVPIGG